MRTTGSRVAAAGALALAALAGVTGRALLDREPRTRPVAQWDEISPTGERLLGLLEQGHRATYRAHYQIKGMQGAGAGAPTLEVWRQGPSRYRQDASATEELRGGQSSFVLDGRLVRCLQTGLDGWQCAAVTGSPERPDRFADVVRDELRGASVEERTATQLRQTVRCFAYRRPGDAPTEVCVTDAGIPTRVARGDLAFELLTLADRVSDRDFEPPAPVR